MYGGSYVEGYSFCGTEFFVVIELTWLLPSNICDSSSLVSPEFIEKDNFGFIFLTYNK